MQVWKYKIPNYLLIIIILLLGLSFYNIYRVIHSISFPNNKRSVSTEDILKSVYYEVTFEYVSWFSYLLLGLILLYINITQTPNLYVKLLLTGIILYLIYFPVFPILNIINLLLYVFVQTPPFIDDISKEFPLHNMLEQHYKVIQNELIHYNGKMECFRKTNPLLNNIDTINTDTGYCWRILYLKNTGKIVYDENTRQFPETLKLIQSDQIHNVFFSVLDPHVEIKPHFGYYKGYLRYHVGIIIPEENGKRPYIICGGQKYEWTEGKGVMFDDMYLHYAKNPTSKKRVVLYFDIKRENQGWFVDFLVSIGNYISENSIAVDLFLKNQHVQEKINI